MPCTSTLAKPNRYLDCYWPIICTWWPLLFLDFSWDFPFVLPNMESADVHVQTSRLDGTTRLAQMHNGNTCSPNMLCVWEERTMFQQDVWQCAAASGPVPELLLSNGIDVRLGSGCWVDHCYLNRMPRSCVLWRGLPIWLSLWLMVLLTGTVFWTVKGLSWLLGPGLSVSLLAAIGKRGSEGSSRLTESLGHIHMMI